MSYFFDTEYPSRLQPGKMVKQKGRVYKVVNRKGDLSYYEITQETMMGDEKLCNASFACFDLTMYPIPQEDLDRALTRKSKAG